MDARTIRRWFAWSAVAIVAIVIGFYSYARWKYTSAVKNLGKKLDITIEQAAQGFTLTKSESGRTLFLIHANSVEKHTGGNALLHGVNIVIYNEDGSGADQIYGDDFEYDAASQIVKAEGVVHMDLEGSTDAPLKPGQIPDELKNPVHLKTSGLVFNQKTGMAETPNRLEFHTPQSNGSAVGALYDSKSQNLTLRSQIHIQLAGEEPTNLAAEHAEVSRQKRQAVLLTVKMDRRNETLVASVLTLDFSAEQQLTGGSAQKDVRIQQGGLTIFGQRLDFTNGPHGDLSGATMDGGLTFQDSTGGRGSAQRADLVFDTAGHAEKIRARGDVRFQQPGSGAKPQSSQLLSDSLEIFLNADGKPVRAFTGGAAGLVLTQPAATRVTTVTADGFEWRFDGQGQLAALEGTHHARSVTMEANQPDAVSTSDVVLARFHGGALVNVTQQGNFRFTQGMRNGQAERAIYDAQKQSITLTGAARLQDGNTSTTADAITFDQVSGRALADGNVKSTVVSKTSPTTAHSGGLFAGSDPMHITARHLLADSRAKVAHYSGAVRAWQGTSIVEAPLLDLYQETQSALASSGENSAPAAVRTSFVQSEANGTGSPVNVVSTRLRYDGEQRVAHFEGHTTLRSAERTLDADHADVFLAPAATSGGKTSGQLEKIVAEGSVRIQEPGRSGQGEHLIYTAADKKYVLSGSDDDPPSIFDAEHGKVTGDSLTFFSHDDRVLVSSASNSRTTSSSRVKTTPH